MSQRVWCWARLGASWNPQPSLHHGPEAHGCAGLAITELAGSWRCQQGSHASLTQPKPEPAMQHLPWTDGMAELQDPVRGGRERSTQGPGKRAGELSPWWRRRRAGEGAAAAPGLREAVPGLPACLPPTHLTGSYSGAVQRNCAPLLQRRGPTGPWQKWGPRLTDQGNPTMQPPFPPRSCLLEDAPPPARAASTQLLCNFIISLPFSL